METMQNAVRCIGFTVFFTVGATVVCMAALCDDLVRYCSHKQQLTVAQHTVELLERLNADYSTLLDKVHQDPNMLRRIAPATLGTWPQEPNTAYPTVRIEELLAARQTLCVTENPPEEPMVIPEWLARCSQPGRRWGLFLAGAALVVVAFACFRPQDPIARAGRCSVQAGSSETPTLPSEQAETTSPSYIPEEEPRG